MITISNIDSLYPNSGTQTQSGAMASAGRFAVRCNIGVEPTTADLANLEWRFQPVHFNQSSPPPVWYDNDYYQIAIVAPVLGFEYPSTFVGTQSKRIGTITLRYEDGGNDTTDVFIIFYYHNVQDFRAALNLVSVDNIDVLLKQKIGSPNILDNSDPLAVYSNTPPTTANQLWLRPAIRELDIGDVSTFTARNNNQQSAFYNDVRSLSAAPGAGYMTDPEVITEISAGPIPGAISSVEPTLVRLRASDFNGVLASQPFQGCNMATDVQVFAYLIRVDQSDDSVPFWESYNLQYAVCGVSISTPLSPYYEIGNDGTFTNPSSPSNMIAPNRYEAQITLDPNFIDPAGTYRIIHVWRIYDCSALGVLTAAKNPDYKYADWSFISDEITVNRCGIPVRPALRRNVLANYFGEYGPHAEFTPLERIESRIVMEGGDYDQSPARQLDFVSAVQRIRARVYAENNGQRQVMRSQDILRTGGGLQAPALEGFGFDATGGRIAMSWPFRVANQGHLPNLFNETASGATLPADSTQNWVGRDIYVEYTFFLTNTNPATGEEIQEQFTVRQKFSVRDIDVSTLTARIETPEGLPAREYCVDQPPAFLRLCAQHTEESQALGVEAATNFFVGVKQTLPGNPAQTNEDDPLASPTGLFQLQPGFVQSADPQYNPGNDTACGTLDTALIPAEEPRRYYGLQLNRGYALSVQGGAVETGAFPHIPEYMAGCGGFSIACWVWLNAPQTAVVVSKGRESSVNGHLAATPTGNGNWQVGGQPRWNLTVRQVGGLSYFSAGWTYVYQPGTNQPANRRCEIESAPGSLSAGQWHQLVWVRPPNAHRAADCLLYIDGALVATNPLGFATGTSGGTDTLLHPNQCNLDWVVKDDGFPMALSGASIQPSPFVGISQEGYWQNDGPITIGGQYVCGQPLSEYFPAGSGADMFLKNLQIYTRELPALEIANQFQVGPGSMPISDESLVLLARMNENEGQQICDTSQYLNHGELVDFGAYDVPANSVQSCTVTQQRNHGYTAARRGLSGGAWVRA